MFRNRTGSMSSRLLLCPSRPRWYETPMVAGTPGHASGVEPATSTWKCGSSIRKNFHALLNISEATGRHHSTRNCHRWPVRFVRNRTRDGRAKCDPRHADFGSFRSNRDSCFRWFRSGWRSPPASRDADTTESTVCIGEFSTIFRAPGLGEQLGHDFQRSSPSLDTSTRL